MESTAIGLLAQAEALHERFRQKPGFAGVAYAQKGLAVRCVKEEHHDFRNILSPSFRRPAAGETAYRISVAAEVEGKDLVGPLGRSGWVCSLLSTEMRGQRQLVRVAATNAPGRTDFAMALKGQVLFATVELEPDDIAVDATGPKVPVQTWNLANAAGAASRPPGEILLEAIQKAGIKTAAELQQVLAASLSAGAPPAGTGGVTPTGAALSTAVPEGAESSSRTSRSRSSHVRATKDDGTSLMAQGTQVPPGPTAGTPIPPGSIAQLGLGKPQG